MGLVKSSDTVNGSRAGSSSSASSFSDFSGRAAHSGRLWESIARWSPVGIVMNLFAGVLGLSAWSGGHALPRCCRRLHRRLRCNRCPAGSSGTPAEPGVAGRRVANPDRAQSHGAPARLRSARGRLAARLRPPAPSVSCRSRAHPRASSYSEAGPIPVLSRNCDAPPGMSQVACPAP